MGVRETTEGLLRRALVPMDGSARDYDTLRERIGDARFVLLGSPSNGMHELWRERARLTTQLIERMGFDAVALDADWSPTQRVHRWVKGRGVDATAAAALGGFTGFPGWTWRNTEVAAFMRWLRSYDDAHPRARVGLFGLDLYDLGASTHAALRYLDEVDPAAAARARDRYTSFGTFGRDTPKFAYLTSLGLDEPLEHEATRRLVARRARAVEAARREADTTSEDLLPLVEDPRIVKNADEYYRSTFRGSVVSWNLRDRHMADTLGELAARLDHRLGRPCKIVVWAHNAHLGDARATEMGEQGEINMGQLVRERHGRDAFSVGMTTYDGTVYASSDWEGAATQKEVRPAIEASWEALLHRMGVPRFVLAGDADRRLPDVLPHQRLERAIGAVYRPDTERVSHWFEARLGTQFDALIHVDRTRAVEPLDREGPDAPEAEALAPI